MDFLNKGKISAETIKDPKGIKKVSERTAYGIQEKELDQLMIESKHLNQGPIQQENQ